METYTGLLRREASMDPFEYAVRKNQNYLSWDEYFMGVAFLSSMRSKDPSTQVGACLVNADKCIVGIGYNGFPRGCSDDILPWSRSASDTLHRKYPYVVHAEVNAILNKCSASIRGATLYVALFPCNECAKVIIQSGIREVVYLHDIYHDTDACKASRIMFRMAGVKLRLYRPEWGEIGIELIPDVSNSINDQKQT
jgi:dCMP deaminase